MRTLYDIVDKNEVPLFMGKMFQYSGIKNMDYGILEGYSKTDPDSLTFQNKGKQNANDIKWRIKDSNGVYKINAELLLIGI